MRDGTYRYVIEMQAPLGPRTGELWLQLVREQLSGTLTLFRKTSPVLGKRAPDGSAELQGTMYTLISSIDFKAIGRMTETGLNMDFVTDRGTFPTTGTPTPQNANKGR